MHHIRIRSQVPLHILHTQSICWKELKPNENISDVFAIRYIIIYLKNIRQHCSGTKMHTFCLGGVLRHRQYNKYASCAHIAVGYLHTSHTSIYIYVRAIFVRSFDITVRSCEDCLCFQPQDIAHIASRLLLVQFAQSNCIIVIIWNPKPLTTAHFFTCLNYILVIVLCRIKKFHRRLYCVHIVVSCLWYLADKESNRADIQLCFFFFSYYLPEHQEMKNFINIISHKFDTCPDFIFNEY